jgi:hypothetical protein
MIITSGPVVLVDGNMAKLRGLSLILDLMPAGVSQVAVDENTGFTLLTFPTLHPS